MFIVTLDIVVSVSFTQHLFQSEATKSLGSGRFIIIIIIYLSIYLSI